MQPIQFNSAPGRILIIKPSALGDVVHGLPVLTRLREKWPSAKISWLVAPAFAGLLENHPLLDEVIHFDRHDYGIAWRSPAAMRRLWRFVRDLRHRQFDLVIDLQGLFRSGWLAKRTKAPMRVGFARTRELAWMFYTHRVPVDFTNDHAVTRNIAIATALGCKEGEVEFPLIGDTADEQHIQQWIPAGTRYAVVLPGTNWATKRWPIEHFAALVEPLQSRFNLKVITAGGPGDVDLANQIPGALNLAGKTTLKQLVALLKRADLVIANDSGPMHIGAALIRPLVALFGPTNPTRTGPYTREDTVLRLDINCSPCYSRTCSHQSCLRWLALQQVLKAAEQQLQSNAGGYAQVSSEPVPVPLTINRSQ